MDNEQACGSNTLELSFRLRLFLQHSRARLKLHPHIHTKALLFLQFYNQVLHVLGVKPSQRRAIRGLPTEKRRYNCRTVREIFPLQE